MIGGVKADRPQKNYRRMCEVTSVIAGHLLSPSQFVRLWFVGGDLHLTQHTIPG